MVLSRCLLFGYLDPKGSVLQPKQSCIASLQPTYACIQPLYPYVQGTSAMMRASRTTRSAKARPRHDSLTGFSGITIDIDIDICLSGERLGGLHIQDKQISRQLGQ